MADTLEQANLGGATGQGPLVVRPGGSRRAAARLRGWPWPRASPTEKVAQAVVALALTAALAAGLLLTPSPAGTGTHTVLGLPPCGMLVVTGRPCPTCGVTTSFVLAAHGRLGEALANQPFGLLVFVLTAGGLALTAATLAAGRSWLPLVTANRIVAAIIFLALAGLASWAYKWATIV